MKTVKQGAIPKPAVPWWVGEIITCGNCAAEVELEEGDSVKDVAERRPNGKHTLHAGNCPTCNLALTKIFHQLPR